MLDIADLGLFFSACIKACQFLGWQRQSRSFICLRDFRSCVKTSPSYHPITTYSPILFFRICRLHHGVAMTNRLWRAILNKSSPSTSHPPTCLRCRGPRFNARATVTSGSSPFSEETKASQGAQARYMLLDTEIPRR